MSGYGVVSTLRPIINCLVYLLSNCLWMALVLQSS